MGIVGWFDTREGDELAATIVAELVKRVPPEFIEAWTYERATLVTPAFTGREHSDF